MSPCLAIEKCRVMLKATLQSVKYTTHYIFIKANLCLPLNTKVKSNTKFQSS